MLLGSFAVFLLSLPLVHVECNESNNISGGQTFEKDLRVFVIFTDFSTQHDDCSVPSFLACRGTGPNMYAKSELAPLLLRAFFSPSILMPSFWVVYFNSRLFGGEKSRNSVVI